MIRDIQLRKKSKLERLELDKVARRAAWSALRSHFTGAGVWGRTVKFLGSIAYYGVGSFLILLVLCSWAIVYLLVISPGDKVHLEQLHSYLVVTPFDQVNAKSQELLRLVAWKCAPLALIAGVAFSLNRITGPAVKDAKQHFNEVASNDQHAPIDSTPQ